MRVTNAPFGDNRDDHPTEPSPPPQVVEEEPPPSTSPTGAKRRAESTLLPGEASGEIPPFSRSTLIPRAAGAPPIFLLETRFAILDEVTALFADGGLDARDERDPGEVARVATYRWLDELRHMLRTYGTVLEQGKPCRLVVREGVRTRRRVFVSIAVEPVEDQ